MEHCVSLRAVPEEKALKQSDLNDGARKKRDMDENACCEAGTGGWEDELGEDDPQCDGENEEGALGDQKEDSRRPDALLGKPRTEEGEITPWLGLGLSRRLVIARIRDRRWSKLGRRRW